MRSAPRPRCPNPRSRPGSESADAWYGFPTDLVGRGLRPPLLIVCDGAPGPIGAAERVLSRSLRQRCLVHRACDVPAKVSAGDRAAVKAAYRQIFDIGELGEDVKPGWRLVDWVQWRIGLQHRTACSSMPTPTPVTGETTRRPRIGKHP